MDVCRQCGARLGPHAAWCGQCYAPVSGGAEVSTAPAAPPAASPASAPSRFGTPSGPGLAPAAPTGTPAATPAAPSSPAIAGWAAPAGVTVASPPVAGVVVEPPTGRMRSGWALLLGFGAVGLGAVFQGVLYLLLRDSDVAPVDLVRYLIVGLLGFYLVIGLIVAVPLVRDARLRWGDGSRVVSVVVGGGIGLGLASLLLGVQSLVDGQVTSDQNAVLMMSEGTLPYFLATFAIVVVAAPLVEETLFRGLLLESLRGHGVKIALLVSAVAFSAWHLNLSAWRYYLVAGLILGTLYVKRGLAASMAAHAAFNGTLVVVGMALVLTPATTVVDGPMSVPVPRGWSENGPGIDAESRRALQDVPGMVALTGPSGSGAIFMSQPGDGRVLSTEQLVATVDESLARTVPGVAGATAGDVGVVDLPVGPAVVVPFDSGGYRSEAYVISRPSGLCVVVFVDSGSAKARGDFRRILEGLRLA